MNAAPEQPRGANSPTDPEGPTDPERNDLTAERALDQTDTARAAAASVATRPSWTDAVFSAGIGATVGTASSRTMTAWIIAAVIFAVTVLVRIVVDRSRRHRGRIVDVQATTVPALSQWTGAVLVVFVIMFPAPSQWQPWWGVGAGAVVAVVAFVTLRIGERDQIRRLRSGDYGPYDLV